MFTFEIINKGERTLSGNFGPIGSSSLLVSVFGY